MLGALILWDLYYYEDNRKEEKENTKENIEMRIFLRCKRKSTAKIKEVSQQELSALFNIQKNLFLIRSRTWEIELI